MGEAAERVARFDELYGAIRALPERLTGQILHPGVLQTMGRPNARHRYAARRILRGLGDNDLMNGGRGWWFEIEAEIRFPEERLVVPDIGGWQVDEQPPFVEQNPIEVIPDFCCEILSPTTTADDRTVKLPMYAACGVEWTWLVDPSRSYVEVYEARDGKPHLALRAEAHEQVVLPPFDSQVSLASWWMPRP